MKVQIKTPKDDRAGATSTRDSAETAAEQFQQVAAQTRSQIIEDDAGKASCCGFPFRRGASAASAPKVNGEFVQTIAIVRHSERLDHKTDYRNTEEGKKRPFDTPITANGVRIAKQMARDLKKVHAKARFTAIAVSPYRRCLETANEVAKALKLPIVIDQELGEIYDQGNEEFPRPWRTGAELKAFTDNLGLKVLNPPDGEGYKLFGMVPQYPEAFEEAQMRFMTRIESYIHHGVETECNYIVITHADCVSIVLMMFEREEAEVTAMDYCGRVVATRHVKDFGKGHVAKADEAATGTYGDKWEVEYNNVTQVVAPHFRGANGKMHEDICKKIEAHSKKRGLVHKLTQAQLEEVLKEAKKGKDDNQV
mmetsp:Transcript_122707/g.261863  ORF Transcript_122707/g.261863 Transcript_122707/m.261863 type:complete len:366 (-) Transcript_122707:100-1197(-)